MGRFSRDELEAAFQAYLAASAKSALAGDWTAWAEHLTEDATWFEHQLPTPVVGRAAILGILNKAMTTPPMDHMKYFPIEWYVLDEERGWVVCAIWNRMDDPGDGSLHQEYNITLLKYAGDGKWSYQEDIYNPKRFEEMLANWVKARDAAAR